MSEWPRTLIIRLIGIIAAKALGELSIAAADDEAFAQQVGRGDTRTEVAQAGVGSDLPGGDGDIFWIKRVNKREFGLRNQNRSRGQIKVVHQTVGVLWQSVIVPTQPIVQGQSRRDLKGIHSIQPEFPIRLRSVHKRIGSLAAVRQAEQEIAKTGTQCSTSECTVEREAAIIGNHTPMEVEGGKLGAGFDDVASLFPCHNVFVGKGSVVVLYATINRPQPS